MVDSWFFFIGSAVLAVALAVNLRSGLREGRINYGHVFRRQLYADRYQSPRLFLGVVWFHIFGLFGFALGLLFSLR
jgi:tryptophan-rich sensory protein